MPLAGRREVKGKFPPIKEGGGLGEAISPLQGKGWWSLGGGCPCRCVVSGVYLTLGKRKERVCSAVGGEHCPRGGGRRGAWPWDRAREGVCPRGESVAGINT